MTKEKRYINITIPREIYDAVKSALAVDGSVAKTASHLLTQFVAGANDMKPIAKK